MRYKEVKIEKVYLSEELLEYKDELKGSEIFVDENK